MKKSDINLASVAFPVCQVIFPNQRGENTTLKRLMWMRLLWVQPKVNFWSCTSHNGNRSTQTFEKRKRRVFYLSKPPPNIMDTSLFQAFRWWWGGEKSGRGPKVKLTRVKIGREKGGLLAPAPVCPRFFPSCSFWIELTHGLCLSTWLDRGALIS